MPSPKITSLGCGCDAGKDKSVLFFAAYYDNGQMKCIASKSIKMTVSELKKAVVWIKAKRSKVDPTKVLPFQIVLESTSRYHERLLHLLYEAKLPVCLVQGRLLKLYLGSLGNNSKTDKLDAKGMAHFACCRKARLWKPFSDHILQLRDLLRARKNLIKRANQFRNQLHSLGYARFTSKEIARSYKRLVAQLLKELDKLEAAIKKLYEKDKTLRKKVAPIVKDVKGLGLLTVLTVAAETNGFTTVDGQKQLAKYAGYDIIENQSGKFAGKTRISKRGNANIRTAMYMAALSHIRFGEGNIVNAYNRASAKKPDIYKHANVVVQRKLLLLIHTLWTTGAKYDPHHIPEQNQPKAFSTSIAKNTPEQCPEVHGIASSEEALPNFTQS